MFGISLIRALVPERLRQAREELRLAEEREKEFLVAYEKRL